MKFTISQDRKLTIQGSFAEYGIGRGPSELFNISVDDYTSILRTERDKEIRAYFEEHDCLPSSIPESEIFFGSPNR
jgi:hypothetical protein